MLERLASFSFRRRRYVLAAWLLALPLTFAISGAVGGTFSNNQGGGMKSSDSQRAVDLLNKSFPEMAGQAGDRTGSIVFEVPAAAGGLEGKKTEIEAFLTAFSKNAAIGSVTSPFDGQSSLSQDKTIGTSTIDFKSGVDLEKAGPKLPDLASGLRKQGVVTEFSGQYFGKFEFPPSEIFGVLAAIIILLVAFGSVIAMGLPILTALLGVSLSFAVVGLWAALISMPSFVTSISAMIGLGVGIDYVLFIVTRYREELKTSSPHDATVRAIGTAGKAVVFAGMTVMISMLCMFIIGLEFINGIAVAGATPVFIIVIAALTLIPALLGFAGQNINKISIHRKHVNETKETGWHRWSRTVQRRAWPFAIGGFVVLVIATIPLASLRLGFTDQGNDKSSSTTRKAYDLLAKGYGVGANGKFIVAVDFANAKATDTVVNLVNALGTTPGVASAVGPVPSKDGTSAVIFLQPSTSPQAEATSKLVHTLRDNVIPSVVTGTGVNAYVGGFTAGGIDFADLIGKRLPVFMGVVLLLTFFLLMAVFRSILVPLKAVIMNMLSIGAAYGVVVAVFQWGYLGSLIGLGKPGPIEPWMPMMLFAIVFGLSMDYEVFLLSKIKEEYDHRRDNSTAVVEGLASTARVITSAAAIMVCVFAFFVLGNRQLKLMGLGLATAIFVDATLVRIVLVPATMELLGDRNWWFPKWLDRVIPNLNIEGRRTDQAIPTAAGK